MDGKPESDETVAHLRRAGWHPGRDVDITDWVRVLGDNGHFSIHPAAETFLKEFGGLHIPRRGRVGITMAPMEIDFDPVLCQGQHQWFRGFRSTVHGSLYPLGEVEQGHASLAIDEGGEVYMLFANQCRRIGTGRQAVVNLVEGRRGS